MIEWVKISWSCEEDGIINLQRKVRKSDFIGIRMGGPRRERIVLHARGVDIQRARV